MFISLVSALGLVASSQFQMVMDPPPEEMAPLITANYDAEAAGIAAFACADDDVDCLADELIERFRVDQWARGQFGSMEICEGYAQTHPQQCQMQIMGVTAFQGDVPNLARLKEIMDVHGWPSPPVFPAEAQRAAWYIAQHGQFISEAGSTQWDADFAQSILPYVMEAVHEEELTAWAYGAMFDRIRRTRGEPQRYATQIMCGADGAEFGELEDTERVSEFRAEIGMDPFDPAAYDAWCTTNQ